MLEFERSFWTGSPSALLAGVDEAGRGPLAGPVFASAVMIPREEIGRLAEGPLAGLTDSKKLSPGRRERFLAVLTSSPCVRVGVGVASVGEIDRLDVLRATHLAMRRSLLALGSPPPGHVLVDGLPVEGLPAPSTAIVGGDAKSLLVAAASVVAKVERDRLMVALDALYPGYGFARHKGYGTKAHLEALRRLGPSPAHRKTFAPVAALLAQETGPFHHVP